MVWFIFAFFSGLVTGIIPISIERYMGVSAIGWLSAVIYIAPILGSYAAGKFSDIKGRKRTLVAGFAVALAGAAVLWLAHSPLPLTLGVLLVAASRATLFPLTFALVGDISTRENLASLAAFFLLIQSLGFVIAFVVPLVLKMEALKLGTPTPALGGRRVLPKTHVFVPQGASRCTLQPRFRPYPSPS